VKARHAVIYVPGIGDHALNGRKNLLWAWRYKNIDIEVCRMYWTVDEPWEDKLARLVTLIDQRHAEGKLVTIIGESAGATAVINALFISTDKLHNAILLCGKSQYPERVGASIYRRNPAFKEALTDSHAIVQRLTKKQKAMLINMRPLFDQTVPVGETKIPGVRNIVIPSAFHAVSIVFAMTFWNWRIVRLMRRHALQ
jgi:hypothetical protein